MLSVNLYHQTRSIYTLAFIKKERENTIVVTPDPLSADAFRAKLQEKSADVLTLSKFISDWSESHDLQNDKIWRKSEVLQYLAIAWKKYNCSLPDAAFFQAFKQITELRAFSLNLELIKEVLDEAGPEMAQMIEKLWMLYDVVGIQDEQQAYLNLSESLKKNIDMPYQSKNIIFWGFRFLNGHQIDLLKSLAIRNDVYLPIAKDVYNKAISSDWVSWINGDVELIDTPYEDQYSHVSCYHFAKNRLSESSASLLNHMSAERENFYCDIFLACNRPELNQLREVSFDGLHFKAQTSLFSSYFEEFFKKLEEGYLDQDMSDAISYIKESYHIELKNKKSQSFARIKAMTDLYHTLKSWKDLSDENQLLTKFDLEVLKEVLELNASRASWIPSQQNNRGMIRGVEGLEVFNENVDVLLIAKNEYSGLLGKDSMYSEKTMEFLQAIAPVRRSEFESYFLSFKIKEMLDSPNTHLLLEKEIEESSEFWGQLLSNIEDRIKWCDLPDLPIKEQVDVLEQQVSACPNEKRLITSLSASKLQNYLDCPRKYFFNYCQNLNTDLVSKEVLAANEIGEIEHLALEILFSRQLKGPQELSEQVVADIATAAIEKVTSEKNKEIAPEDYEEVFLEVFHATQRGANGVFSLLENSIENCEYFSEVKLEESYLDLNIKGSIDFLMVEKDFVHLIDFKRSAGSVPTRGEVENYQSIQSWFYLHFVPEKFKSKKLGIWGYLCLRDIASSRLWTSDEIFFQRLKSSPLLSKSVTLMEEREAKQKEFASLLKESIGEMKQQTTFPARPQSQKACQFCSVSTLCHKGGK